MIKRLSLLLTVFLLVLAMAMTVEAANLTSGLVSCWDFEDNLAIDSADDNNGTISGTVNVTGYIGDAQEWEFGGGSDHICIDNPANLQIQDLTVSFWYFQESDDGGYSAIIGQQNSWIIGISDDDTGKLFVGQSGQAPYLHSSAVIPNNGWNFYVVTIDGNGGNTHIWINNTNDSMDVGNAPLFSFTGNRGIGRDRCSSDGIDGIIDQMAIWNRTLDNDEINDLWNNSGGMVCSDMISPPPPPSNSSTIDIIFTNTSGNAQTVFGEGENFNVYLNWTDDSDSSIINQSAGGSCNLSAFSALVESEGNNSNFTLCDSGCDFSERRREVNISATNAVNDSIHFNGCHNQVVGGDMQINFSCGSSSEEINIDATDLPLCSTGTAFIFIGTNVCTNSSLINVSTNTSGNIPFSQRKTILDVAFDREYSEDLMVNGSELNFNGTTQLWEIDHTHEYYVHGSKLWYGNCSHLTDPFFDQNATENITIVNIPPQVSFSSVQTSLGITNLSDEVDVEYSSGGFNFIVSIVDDDLDSFNFSIYNSSVLIASTINETELNLSSAFFLDFESNPYSINITANDSGSNTTVSGILFNITDTLDPICNFSANYTTQVNSTIEFGNSGLNITCEDENFFSLNVTCTPDLTFFIDGLNTTSYVFNGSITPTVNQSCSFEYCDGHTGSLDKNKWSVDIVNDSKFEMTFNQKDISLGVSKGSNLSYKMKDDRITFTVKKQKNDSVTFTYKVSNNSYYFQSKEYSGWIVDSESRTWIDFNPYVTTVSHLGAGEWEIVIDSTDTELTFESIGELNCVNGTFIVFTTPIPPTPLQVGVCPQSTSLALMLILVVVVALFLMWVGWKLRIGIAGFFGSFILLISSWYIAGCSGVIGGLFILISLFFMLWFLFMRRLGLDHSKVFSGK